MRVGFGTVANVLLIGTSAQLGLTVIPQQTVPVLQVLVFAGGLALVAVATGLYIGARLGPGPRDGLMTGLHARTGWPIWIVRTSIEVVVLAVGWALGGQFGIGTIAFALLIGPMVGVTLPLLRIRSVRMPPHRLGRGGDPVTVLLALRPHRVGSSATVVAIPATATAGTARSTTRARARRRRASRHARRRLPAPP